MSILFGETNLDGKGSAANLLENGQMIDLSVKQFDFSDFPHEWSWDVEDGMALVSSTLDHYHSIFTSVSNTGEWNESGMKEVYIDSNDAETLTGEYNLESLTVENYVDVYINLTEELANENGETQINVIDAKRGEIDTQDAGSVNIEILANSNGDSWSNLFDVTTGDSDDEVQLYYSSESSMTEWTEFSVALNGGDDSFHYDLADAASELQTRFVDGGDDEDTLVLYSDTDDLDFANFEHIETEALEDVTLTLNQELLSNNADGLTISGVDIDFSDQYDEISATEQLDENGQDTGYWDVTVSYDDASYTLVTDSIDQDWAA